MNINLCPVSDLAGADPHLSATATLIIKNADFIIKNPIILSKPQIYYQIPFIPISISASKYRCQTVHRT
jgi:hypothetical protein